MCSVKSRLFCKNIKEFDQKSYFFLSNTSTYTFTITLLLYLPVTYILYCMKEEKLYYNCIKCIYLYIYFAFGYSFNFIMYCNNFFFEILLPNYF